MSLVHSFLNLDTGFDDVGRWTRAICVLFPHLIRV